MNEQIDLNSLAYFEQVAATGSFTAAADQLYTAPDPRDERRVSTRVQLGLLVDAEAARAAQAATLLPQGVQRASLRTSAQRLALLGDRLWDPRLGVRDSGLPAISRSSRSPSPVEPQSGSPFRT